MACNKILYTAEEILAEFQRQEEEDSDLEEEDFDKEVSETEDNILIDSDNEDDEFDLAEGTQDCSSADDFFYCTSNKFLIFKSFL